ncbi:hypothetical protein [Modestobacter versicolor]|uniref:Uncharacterized protein n=1 Tax=Modestobacter versicolor TaxID=429133 RepID=A0A323VBM9_9ACTN|nr:hypothetical protein [Modestobacter versicolor]MBB3678310.1 hypothetical protein [Modestobacter versicolor]PZA22095.1 hypothetical protein DMO24_06770 [Modestobacter versicolor]
MSVGRPLTRDERAVLDALLADDVPDVATLRVQASTVLATRGCSCGCGTIDLAVDPVAPLAATAERDPVEATVVDQDGRVVGGLLLFVAGGRLTGLEVYGFGDEPLPMPPADRVLR